MPDDLRKYAKQTNARLLVGFFIILGFVGLGSIYLFYGQGAALSGLICIGLALIPALLVWIALTIIGWAARKLDE